MYSLLKHHLLLVFDFSLFHTYLFSIFSRADMFSLIILTFYKRITIKILTNDSAISSSSGNINVLMKRELRFLYESYRYRLFWAIFRF